MENFDEARAFVHAVVNQDRSMHELADTRTACDWATDERKTFEQIDVIENGVAEAFRRGGEVEPRIIEDFLEVG